MPAPYHLTAAPAAAADTPSGAVYDTGGVQLVDGKNPLVYSTNTYYNTTSCTLIDVQQMGRWKIAEVLYSPFEYNPVTGSLLVAADTTLVLSYKTNAPLPPALASKTTWDADAASMLVNYSDASLGYAAASFRQDA